MISALLHSGLYYYIWSSGKIYVFDDIFNFNSLEEILNINLNYLYDKYFYSDITTEDKIVYQSDKPIENFIEDLKNYIINDIPEELL